MVIITPEDIHPAVRIANYFAVPPDTVWGPRAIPDWELVFVVSGGFVYRTSDAAEYPVPAGHVLCIPPLVRHTFQRIDHRKQAVISCIHGELVSQGSWVAGDYRLDPTPPLVTAVGSDQSLHGLFKRCNDVFCGLTRYRSALLETIAREIWIRLAERWSGPGDPRLSRRTQQMIQFLREHLAGPISRQDMAKAFGVTPEHVNALFKKELGISPTQLIHRERAFQAYRLIHHEGLSIKEAADRIGFADPFYFSKIFKKVMGISPSRV